VTQNALSQNGFPNQPPLLLLHRLRLIFFQKDNHNPLLDQTSSILHPLSRTSSSNNHRALHPTSIAAPFIANFRVAFRKTQPHSSRQTRDTAHQLQSQLAFPSIAFRIKIDCYRSFLCLVLLILTVRSTTSFSPFPPLRIHIQDVCKTR
jgi:hypothetical protein